MRNAFIKTLVECARVNDSIFFISGDVGYSVVEPFAEQFPDRFLNIGIAEQNMTGVAVGLAKEGYNVFTYSIGNFPTLRCLEQIRYDVCYHNASVKIVSVGGGFAYGPLGASHHCTEDIGILRTIPNMVVSAPGDPLETSAIVRWMCNVPGPGYLRLNKGGDRVIGEMGTILVPGAPREVRAGRDLAVIASGAILEYSEGAIDTLLPGAALYSMPVISPIDALRVVQLARQFERIITIEEHQLNCGMGSAIVEVVSDAYAEGILNRVPCIKRIAIPNRFTSVAGTQAYLRQMNGLILQP